MKYAADFRYIAREALRGKWVIAVIAGLIASLLGGLGSDGPEVKRCLYCYRCHIAGCRLLRVGKCHRSWLCQV